MVRGAFESPLDFMRSLFRAAAIASGIQQPDGLVAEWYPEREGAR